MSQPAIYLPHGGGPCFFMDWTLGPPDTWDEMGAWLGGLADTLTAPPSAVVVISAHWEAASVSITSTPTPALIYDYYGFPAHTYKLTYPAPGAPALAAEMAELLGQCGIDASLDPERGVDHGVFIPLKLVFPAANVPIVQLSLHESLDPRHHLDIGRALAPLRARNVLIIGSGMSYHNMSELMSRRSLIEESDDFDRWLDESCQMRAPARDERLVHWRSAPQALNAHPREEHLLPLMVAAGAGGASGAARVFNGRVMGSTVSAFRFD